MDDGIEAAGQYARVAGGGLERRLRHAVHPHATRTVADCAQWRMQPAYADGMLIPRPGPW